MAGAGATGTARPDRDIDVGGVVRVRIHRARDAEIAVVERQLGPSRAATADPADVVIRFADRVATRGPRRLIGLDDVAFSDDAFLLLRGRHKSPAVVRLELDGGEGSIVLDCERGLRSVPLLVALVNLAAARRGVVPVHGTLLVHDGRGVLVVGWSKGGKTETLLAFMARGASFVGDEWIYVAPDATGSGLPEPTRLWAWQLAQFPDLAARVSRGSRLRLRSTGLLAGGLAGVAGARPTGGTTVGSLARRSEPAVSRQLSIQAFPRDLYGAERVLPSARIDHVVLAMSRTGGEVEARPEPLDRTIERIVRSNEHERLDLAAAIAKHGFAFPDRPPTALDGLVERERGLLRAALAGRASWILEHPYPVEIRRLHDVLAPLLAAPPMSPEAAPDDVGR